MTSWAVSALRLARPDLDVTWAVQERCAPVIDTGRLTNSLHVFPREKWKRQRWSPRTWREQIVAYTSLRDRGFDIGFDFQGHSKTALCLFLAGCKRSLAARATDSFAKKLVTPVQLCPQGPHEVQLAHALVSVAFETGLPEFPLMPEVCHSDDIKPADVVVQTGAGEEDKRYPIESWRTVVERLLERGYSVTAIGGANDPRMAVSGVNDLVGKLDLIESMGIIKDSRVHLSGDTGTAHIAAAFGVKTLTLFGRTDPSRFRPWGERGTVLKSRTVSEVCPDQVVEETLALIGGKVAHPR